MQMSDTIIIRGDVIMITRKAEKYINNWIKLPKCKKTDKMTHYYVYKIGYMC